MGGLLSLAGIREGRHFLFMEDIASGRIKWQPLEDSCRNQFLYAPPCQKRGGEGMNGYNKMNAELTNQ